MLFGLVAVFYLGLAYWATGILKRDRPTTGWRMVVFFLFSPLLGLLLLLGTPRRPARRFMRHRRFTQHRAGEELAKENQQNKNK